MIFQARERLRAEDNAKKKRGVYLARLGASSVGDPCLRRVFFGWRAYSQGEPEGRMLNLFETGHITEKRVVEDLRLAGCRVWDLDPNAGKQFTYTDPATGHFIVKLDGVIKGVPGYESEPHVLEIKSHNDAHFTSLIKRGLQEAEPEHYVQCQAGMWLSGLTSALYVARNKNDERYYFQRVRFDQQSVSGTVERIISLYNATLIPAGVSVDATGYVCRYCGEKGVCLGAKPLTNCRTCKHVEPGPEGSWLCNLWEKTLDWDEQRRACPEWKALQAEPLK